MHRDVALIFFFKDDRILIQDRRNIRKFVEDWGFFGGGMNPGESPDEAVVRETREELGYELRDYSFVRKSNHSMPDRTFTVFAFAAPCPELGAFNQKEGQGMKLVTEEEALKLRFNPPDYDIIKYVFDFLRSGKNKLR
jgi:mutator protein MutT